MIDTLALAIREGFGLVIASMLPLFVVAAVSALLIGLLGGSLNLRDAALGQIVRALAVLLAIGLLVEGVAVATVEFAARTWGALASSESP